MEPVLIILFILGSYILGSVSPSYFFGWLKGIDIRKHGTKNAGAKNAWSVLGKQYGILTAVIDLTKGFITVFAGGLAGLQTGFLFLVFLATLIGHNYPFYLKTGGSGLAVTIGSSVAIIFLVSLEKAIIFIVLAFTIFYLLTRMVIYPNRYKKKKRIRVWRKTLRFAALGLPLIYIYTNKAILLWVVIPIALFFWTNDILRYFSLNSLTIFSKENENIISGMSYFMLGVLIAVLLFQKNIAILTLIFLILGDNFAVIFGSKFGKDIIYKGKTLEGSFFFFASSFLGALIFAELGLLRAGFITILTGAFTATLVELFSNKIDDNITVPIIAGLIMSLI